MLLCGRCATAYDAEDNFCRQCGLSLHDPPLPVVRDESSLPTVWRPPLPAPVVRVAAFLVASRVAELAVRGLAGRVFRFGPKSKQSADEPATTLATNGNALPPEETEMVSETVFMRRIRFRR